MAVKSDEASRELLERTQRAMQVGARLDVVRMLFNPDCKWGVQIYEKGKTKGGNDKWVKIGLILPGKNETVVDVLRMLGEMAEEAP